MRDFTTILLSGFIRFLEHVGRKLFLLPIPHIVLTSTEAIVVKDSLNGFDNEPLSMLTDWP